MKCSSYRLLALACPGLLPLPALAAMPVLEPVIITATRVPQLLQTAPIGASIITAEQIERAGVMDANEAIRKLGGVASKSDLNNGREHSLDLRGFGDTASQNLVVVVDGIRLSENEIVTARLSAIPIEQIDRIEIIRGGASVSWGEGATAGVINVILKQHQAERSTARVSAAVGSFKGRDARFNGTVALGSTTFEASLRHLESDGWRDNGANQQQAGSLGLRWADGGWRVALRVQREEQDARLPGSLTFGQFEADSRQTVKPNDYYKADETLYVANVQYQAGPWTAAVDLGHKALSTQGAYSLYVNDTDRRKRQISPRLTYLARRGDIVLTSTVGLEWQHWHFDNETSDGLETGEQSNRAHYVHAEMSLPSKTRLSVGARRETVRKQADSPITGYDRSNKLNAGEFAVNQTVRPGLDVYSRLASSFRLPNIDENRFTALSQALRPQKSSDQEVGLKWRAAKWSGAVRWFKQKTRDELAFDSSLFVTANIDPTRRQGYELEGQWNPTGAWTVSATWQDLKARYRSGVNDGKEQVLVAPRTATLRAAYRFDERQTLDVGVQYMAAMRFGDDTANDCTRRIPESTLVDARYAWAARGWTVALSGTNLTDQQGYNYAFSCASGALYPEPGRAVKLSVAYQF